MKRRSPFLLALIFLITIVVTAINIPPVIHLSYKSPKLPILNTTLQIDKTIPGFNPNIILGPVRIHKDLSFHKGLDLEGGTSITLRADMSDVPQEKRGDALDSAKEVIERRVNYFGVAEPIVQTGKVNNDYRILAEIPGITDVNQAIALIGTTAKLTFWEEGASGSAKPVNPALLPYGITQLLGPDAKETNLTGSDLESSAVVFDTNTGKPQVQLAFTPDGSKKFAEITRKNVGKIVAIVLDNQVIEAPRVQDVITQGSAVITGEFSTEVAKALSVQLNAGALPVPLSVLEQHTVGATLGAESLQKSLVAGILGFFVIVVFMCILYGRLGVIASGALLIYTLIVLALFRLIPVTLTLAGIAGLILSIGIAVDANILIFERMKEELRSGKSDIAAIELGFSRAWPSIRDSNIASIITSLILFEFGTGPVRGFALTLLIGVLVSMFSAIVVTKTFVVTFYKEKRRTNGHY